MLECVDADDSFYLIMGTDIGCVRLQEKPPVTEESYRSIPEH